MHGRHAAALVRAHGQRSASRGLDPVTRYPNGAQCSNQSPEGLVGGQARLGTNPHAPDNGHRNEPGQSRRCWSWAENARTPQALSWSVLSRPPGVRNWPWAERPGNSTRSGSLGGSRSWSSVGGALVLPRSRRAGRMGRTTSARIWPTARGDDRSSAAVGRCRGLLIVVECGAEIVQGGTLKRDRRDHGIEPAHHGFETAGRGDQHARRTRRQGRKLRRRRRKRAQACALLVVWPHRLLDLSAWPIREPSRRSERKPPRRADASRSARTVH